MRKYNNSTKKTMIIILILFVVIIIIFSYAIKKSSDIGKTTYEIKNGSILFDEEYNMLTTTNEGILKIKWGGDYYLKYNDKDYNIGPHAIVYNSNNGDTTLYGKFYEVTKTGEVEVITGENLIKSSVNSKFYKLADRKYLIIDRTIESSDSSFVTSNYLIVNLDKLGNATLLNDKTSYKTIKPTTLRTSSYTFDIANEKLNYTDEAIDLKKIIGSTNEYEEDKYNLNSSPKEEEDGSTINNGNGTGDGTGSGNGSNNGTTTGGTGNNGQGTGNNSSTNTNGTTAGSNSDFNNNYSGAISDSTVQEIINATKNTSVIRVISDINSISIDYVVYDPMNEYKSVYIEIENTKTNQINTIYLSKTDTHIKINDLYPDIYYNLKFKYTYNDESNNLKEYTFDEVGLHTKIPKMILTVTEITNNKIYYKINLDNNYTITGGTLNLYINDQYSGLSSSISAKGSINTITGTDCYLDISSLNLDPNSTNVLEVRLVSLSFNTYTINPSINYKFKF